MAAKYYSLKDHSVIFGPVILSGWGESGGVDIAYDEDAFALTVGADGQGTRAANSIRAATITLSLMASSEVNAALSALHDLDRLTPGGAPSTFFLQDRNGTTVYAAATAWIQKMPDDSRGKAVGERQWVIRTDNLAGVAGGN